VAEARAWKYTRGRGKGTRVETTSDVLGTLAVALYSPSAKRNTKHQSQSSREVPNLKPQTPKTDAVANDAQLGL